MQRVQGSCHETLHGRKTRISKQTERHTRVMLNTKTRDKIGPTIDELKEHVKLNSNEDIEIAINYNDAILNDAILEEE